MISKKYNLVNNVTGWVIFVIALATYWLTLEPTASYWDCGEFIIQADKLEVGHPPGNPIFMLTARFFANFAPDALSVPLMVNAMSGLLSALTILLLFWTITHLVRRLVVRDDQTDELSLSKYLIIIGSGVVGALAYCWSDTFWFSAVEGEVYAFSSFCTALVFWLILKWQNRANMEGSDKYLILIAYIIGVSIAVHLLNLLCIPAIVLIFAYTKWSDMNVKKSLLALLVSFVVIVLVLFGLVPGFIKMAQQFELVFVNGFGCSFNTGALVYGVVMALLFIWSIYEIYRGKSEMMIKLSSFLAILCSGMLFIGSWWLGWVLMAALAVWMFSKYFSKMPMRAWNVIMWSLAVIFVGYSSYALILIRSSADTPMNQNSPDNVFDLASYLNREQYGQTPLLYGETLYSGQQKKYMGSHTDTITYYEDGTPVLLTTPVYGSVVNEGKPMYAKGVTGAEPKSEYGFLKESDIESNKKLAARGGDYYVKRDYTPEVQLNPELNMLFPRIYSRMHRDTYRYWVNLDTLPGNMQELYAVNEETGEKVPELDTYGEPYVNQATGMVSYPQKMGYKPTVMQNLEYFYSYQLIHMYMRYFMWNFAGRQNDVLNQQGELDAGNWISGIPAIDNFRLGDQSLLPDDLGKNNRGHNTFYMLPLILGLIGLVWQAFAGKRGIEQFWVVFFLFFMTGIAIVLYLNQPPMQPRERDYAYAGSFYAYAIWIGMGVAGLWQLMVWAINRKKQRGEKALKEETPAKASYQLEEQSQMLTDRAIAKEKSSVYAAIAAVVLGVVIPVQMVSQTWDDHDRSGRYAARDFAVNYLESLEPNAIVFCNGDNDTFPLWYAQEVEGVRPDVKIVNLSYLASDWYANQMRKQSYSAAPIHFTAQPKDIAYGNLDVVLPGRENAPADLMTSLKYIYSGGGRDNDYGYAMLPSSVVTIPVDKKAVVARGLVAPQDTAQLVDKIAIDLANAPSVRGKGYISLSELLMLDIIATNAAEGWPRPLYWCMTVGDEYHLGLSNYMRGVGMTHQLVPTYQEGLPARTDRAYDVVKKYKWGGADSPESPYYDETARRMLVSTRQSMLDVCNELLNEGMMLDEQGSGKAAEAKYRRAVEIADLMDKKLLESTWPYGVSNAMGVPEIYGLAGKRLNDKALTAKALRHLEKTMPRMAQYVAYNRSMSQNFINPRMTLESRLMPYQFYRFVEMYREYGGDEKKLQQMVKLTGYGEEELRDAYNRAYGAGDVHSQTDLYADVTDEQLLSELADAASTVNRLSKLGAEEYAAQPESDRYIDSIYFEAYRQYAEKLGEEMMKANADIAAVDMERSRRIYESYEAAHK